MSWPQTRTSRKERYHCAGSGGLSLLMQALLPEIRRSEVFGAPCCPTPASFALFVKQRG